MEDVFTKIAEEEMIQRIAERHNIKVVENRSRDKKEWKQCKERITEIETMYAKLFEEYSKGKLQESRFQMMSK